MKNIDDIINGESVETIKNNIISKYVNVLNNMENVYIFGAKKLGGKVLNNLKKIEVNTIAFIDNNKKIQNQYIEDKQIISLDKVDKKAIIIVASTLHMNEISDQLENKGYENYIPFYILSLWEKKIFNEEFTLMELQQDIINNKESYKQLFQWLEDEKSKNILLNIIKFRKSLNYKYLDMCYEEGEEQYFDRTIFEIGTDEVFVDCGAFNGDSATKFLARTNEMYKKIYLFEPDTSLMQIAKEKLNKYKDIVYSNCGVYSKNTTLNFEVTGGPDGSISDSGSVEIKVVSLDNIIEEPITFLKMDIEGGEIAAIDGAKSHIKEYKPKMAICVYHNSYDIWKIPSIIKQINPTYKFYLRHYGRNNQETVLYCV